MSWVRATKRGLGTERERERVERVVERAERRALRDLPDLARRRVLALGQTVDLVVEQQDREVHVPAQRVDQVVAADREPVAVAGDDPHVEVRSRHRDAGGDRGRAAVDAVHPVGVHVVREPARAADAAHEHLVLRPPAELGHEQLHRGEHRVVTAAGTPADLLVRREVLAGQGDRVSHRSSPGSSSRSRRRGTGVPAPC